MGQHPFCGPIAPVLTGTQPKPIREALTSIHSGSGPELHRSLQASKKVMLHLALYAEGEDMGKPHAIASFPEDF